MDREDVYIYTVVHYSAQKQKQKQKPSIYYNMDRFKS